jgi:DNA mismatch repair protein MutL
MGIINVLDDSTINKIAAGEVIERPSSIVKELVENALDAGSTDITVEVRNGGIGFIRISDNGRGMEKEDMELAFLRHATSKIRSASDLYTIHTLGFRGEALASIAAVAKVDMLSKSRDTIAGWRRHMEGGKCTAMEESGCQDGTIITVTELFYNTPARLKFLKSETREGSYITDVMQNLAMSHTDVSFKYRLNDKLVFATRGDKDLKSSILAIYGRSFASNLIEIKYSKDLISVCGFIGNANLSKGNRNYQSIYVNGRYVKNKTITAAAEAAYKSMLTINKFPFFVLSLTINPEFVDVNVHPAKSEVKFQDEQMVFSCIFHCVKDGLMAISPLLNDNVKPEEEGYNRHPSQSYTQQSFTASSQPLCYAEEEAIQMNAAPCKTVQEHVHNYSYESNSAAEQYETDDEGTSALHQVPKFGPLSIIGQIHFTYIIAEDSESMYLIDQHAAHERIYYEKYQKAYKEAGIQCQALIAPIVINLSPSEKIMVMENADLFENLGYVLEDFGGGAIALRAVPVIFGNPDPKELFQEVIASFEGGEKELPHTIDKVLYTMACKSAIKAGDKLSLKEMSELINTLRLCDSPFTCPHGRPTIIKMSETELEKKFKRIQ